MISVILGQDRLLARRTRDELLARLDPSGMSIDRLEGNITITAVRDAIATSGFFGGGRVVLVTGLLERLSKSATGKKVSAGDVEGLATALTSRAAENSLIFFDPELGTLVAPLKKALGGATISAHPASRGQPLVSWAMEEAKRCGSALDKPTAIVLLNRLFPGRWGEAKNTAYDQPPDMETLASEIAKLAAFAGESVISAREIEELTPAGEDDRLFPLVDAMASGDRQRALEELGEMAGAGDDELARLANQLISTVELSPFAARARDDSARASIGKQIGISNPRRLAAIARTATENGTRAISVSQAARADRHVKLGRIRSQEELLYSFLIDDTER